MRTLFQVGALISVLLVIEVSPDSDGPVAVITNPWGLRSALEVIAAANGAIVRASPWRWLAVATQADDPNFQAQLRAAGTFSRWRRLLLVHASGSIPAPSDLSQPNQTWSSHPNPIEPIPTT
jgi:hypothetical protein